MDFLGIGGEELLLIMVVILIVMGPAKIPEIARGLGKTVAAFRKASQELSIAVNREIEEEKKILEGPKSVVSEINSVARLAGAPPQAAITPTPAPAKTEPGPGEGADPGAYI